MKSKYLKQAEKIEKALLKGGLVIAPRGYGKTTALANILLKNEDSIVITEFMAQKKKLTIKLLEGGMSPNEISKRVVSALTLKRDPSMLSSSYYRNKDIYADELLFNSYKGPFKAAVTSLPYQVQVIK